MTIHNSSIAAAVQNGAFISIEVRFVSGLTALGIDLRGSDKVDVPFETTIGDLIARYRLSLDQIARVLCNGRDMSPGTYTGGKLDVGASISDGDVITFAGTAPGVPGTRSAAV
jgi:hypothetical protein